MGLGGNNHLNHLISCFIICILLAILPQLFAYNFVFPQKPKATIPTNDIAQLDFGSYNEPNGGENKLGSIGYSTEYFYSKSGEPNTPERTLWFQTSQNWLKLASSLEVMIANIHNLIGIELLSSAFSISP